MQLNIFIKQILFIGIICQFRAKLNQSFSKQKTAKTKNNGKYSGNFAQTIGMSGIIVNYFSTITDPATVFTIVFIQ